MNPHRKWIAAIGWIFLAVAVATSQEKEDDSHNGVGVNLEVLTLCDGLPGAGVASAFPVGGGINVIHRRHIEGHSRWLPNNAIEVTLKITEIDNTKHPLKRFCLRVSSLRRSFCVKILSAAGAIYFA